MTTTEPQQRVTGFCPCCDKPMWADQYADRGFRVASAAGVCSDCPTDGAAPSRPMPTGNVTGRSDQVVGHWATVQSSGVTMKSAAVQLGVTYAAYWQAVARAREAGDSRAEYLPRAGVNTRRESGPDWDRILSRWDRELRPAGMDYRQAAAAVGVPEKTFTNHLWAARNDGDPRAGKRVGAREPAQRDTKRDRATVEGTEWVYTARGWEAPEDVETEGKTETVESRLTADELHEDRAATGWYQEQPEWPAEQARREANYQWQAAGFAPLVREDQYDDDRRGQLAIWVADDQAEMAAGDAEVAL